MRKISVPCPDRKSACPVNHFETVYDNRDMNREYKRGFADAIGTVLSVLSRMEEDTSIQDINNFSDLLKSLKKDVETK